MIWYCRKSIVWSLLPKCFHLHTHTHNQFQKNLTTLTWRFNKSGARAEFRRLIRVGGYVQSGNLGRNSIIYMDCNVSRESLVIGCYGIAYINDALQLWGLNDYIRIMRVPNITICSLLNVWEILQRSGNKW